MKIAVDTTPLMNKGTGIERFVYCMLESLAKSDDINEYILYYHGGLKHNKRIPPKFGFKNGEYKIVKIPLQILNPMRDYLKFPPMELFIGRPDIFWATSFEVPLFWGSTKKICTIHDMNLFINPRQYDKSFSRIKNKMRGSAHCADLIVTISENTKKDINKIFGTDTEKIKTVYCASSPDFFCINDEEINTETRKKYSKAIPFILTVGTLYPRKNFVKLVEAFNIIRKTENMNLVIAGKEGWLFKDIYSKIKELSLEKNIVFTGGIDDENLNLLYNAASVFVFPSLYEGFGIPIVEAMKCGVPVCTSNTSSMPEAAGGAALYFDPDNAREMADSVLKMLGSGALRREFIKKGFEQAGKFSWESSAKQMLEIFKNI